MIENARTGEIVEFVVETPELLRMEVTWTEPGPRAVRHAHPGMDPVALLDDYQEEIVLAPIRS
jgi:hypothetical protein